MKPRPHYHVAPTPIASRYRSVARSLRRRLERDALRGKLPEELRTVKFAVVECSSPNCMPERK